MTKIKLTVSGHNMNTNDKFAKVVTAKTEEGLKTFVHSFFYAGNDIEEARIDWPNGNEASFSGINCVADMSYYIG